MINYYSTTAKLVAYSRPTVMLSSMNRELDLREPIYRQTEAFGHMGCEDLNGSSETRDKADNLSKTINLKRDKDHDRRKG